MNTPRRLNTNRFFPIVRTASASTLVAAAAAMAFVAVKPPSPSLVVKSDSKNQAVAKFRQDRDEMLGNKRALPGLERDRGPSLAAAEDYAKRAYPATDIPFSATLNTRAAFENIQNRTAAATTSAASPSELTWTLIGPSRAVDPSILTFTGTQYFTSGRVTALAIAPTCTPGNCRVWVAAAGGGIWRTDNALSQPPTWTFISGSFATNAIGTLTYDAATGTLYAGTGEPNASADSEAGLGIYKSTDGGNTWTHLASATSVPRLPTSCGSAPEYSGPAFDGRSISSIVVNGGTIYVGSTRGVRGVSSVLSGGVVSLAPRFAAVRIVEVHGRRRALHPVGCSGSLSKSDAQEQCWKSPVELWFPAWGQPRRVGSKQLAYGLCGGVPGRHLALQK